MNGIGGWPAVIRPAIGNSPGTNSFSAILFLVVHPPSSTLDVLPLTSTNSLVSILEIMTTPEPDSKLPSTLESHKRISSSSEDLQQTTSITKDPNGNTIIIQENGEQFTISPTAERALLWKFDLRILPLLTMMYLFNSLDKANLGNAKTAGLEKDLGFAGTNKYNILLSIFFVPYVLTAPVLGIVGKIYGPSRVLPCMMLCFGSMTLLVTAVHNWGGLLALRWFLGMAESAFL